MKAHPSAFLTTRQAAPRIFPFPLGKTRPEAAVREELWWEGGNAPHVVRLLVFVSLASSLIVPMLMPFHLAS